MRYRELAEAYARIEATTARLAMTRLLADLFRATPKRVLPLVVYLTQGQLAPGFAGLDVGVAEKLAVRAVAQAAGVAPEEVARRLARAGDLGTVAEALLERVRPAGPALTVEHVHKTLEAAARATGKGAQAAKLAAIADLLRRATPLEAKYLVRTVTGKLRLGVGDMTVLDALAEVFGGGRPARTALERAYNLTSDLGYVAATVARGGLAAVRKVHVVVGKPIRPMLAERLADPREILAKLGGRCAAEYKYDGERLQIHKQGTQVELYSRRLERITTQYPDVVALVRRHVKAKDAILEGEVVAVDPDTGDLRPFQDLMRRRRKYGIEEAMAALPAAVYAFDLLYVDGQDLTEQPYSERRRRLERTIAPNDRFHLATGREVTSVEALEEFFQQAVADGCEGLICKAAGGVYQAGARGWLWIKFKREYRSELTDTVDLVVVGALHGRGRRAGTYGALLMAAYDAPSGTFPTVCKLGSGFTDEFLRTLPDLLRPHLRPERPARVDSRLVPDRWVEPALVFEVIGAEITLSPIHTAGWGAVRAGAGLAIRFPRFVRVRDDKGPTDATTVAELLAMYRERLKRAAS
ncbi:MAG: ATP-dependent DNA ligase [Armatimonadota bacterium]|nr:ATP-dependent DNA ligase [Armatimonadota bacterium]